MLSRLARQVMALVSLGSLTRPPDPMAARWEPHLHAPEQLRVRKSTANRPLRAGRVLYELIPVVSPLMAIATIS